LEKQVQVTIELGDRRYVVYVEVVRGEIVELEDPVFDLMTDEEIEKVMAILEVDPETKALLDKGAVIRSMGKEDTLQVPVTKFDAW
jgi:ClpP class serine protease